jgi:hypothetical protein
MNRLAILAAFALITPSTSFADDGKIFDCTSWHSLTVTNDYQQFKEQEVSPGKCKMVEDKEGEAETAKMEQHRRDLWWALQTRVLTQEEMAEVRGYGEMINIEPNQPFMEADKQAERNSAFLQQARLQAVKSGKILP